MADNTPSTLTDLLALRRRQQAAWQRGERLLIEVLMADTPAVLTERELLELIDLEVDFRVAWGDVFHEAEYHERFPQVASLLPELFANHKSYRPAHSPLAALDQTPAAEITFVPNEQPSVQVGDSSTFATCGKSGLPDFLLQPALPTSPGSKIGRYRIESVLGEGAFGTAVLAHDEDLQRRVAIKIPRRDRFLTSDQAAAFLEEARTVARLQHPGIVPVYDVGRTEDQSPFVVLAFIDGPSLHAELKARPVTPRRAAELLASIADAVAYAHKQGFIHRDLKPANILLDAQGVPHVADFGLALHESQQAQRKGEYAGTAAYMSPEQIRGEAHHLDGRTDIWALGVMLYHMLTRRLPFAGTTLEQLSDEIQHREPKPPRQIDDTIPDTLERIIARCYHKKVSDRYSTASDLAADLRRWLNVAKDHAKVDAVEIRSNATRTSTVTEDFNYAAAAGLWEESYAMRTSLPPRPDPCFMPLSKARKADRPRNKLFIVVAITLLVLSGVVAFWKPVAERVVPSVSPHPEAAANAPLNGTLDVLIWNKHRGSQAVSLRAQTFRGLRHDDQVRVEAELNRPGYLYILWIDAAGQLMPIYPWESGHWDRRPLNESPVSKISLPQQADLGWPIEGPAGMETLVMLARDTPFTDAEINVLRLSMKDLSRQPAQQSGSVVDFVNGQVVTERDRGPKLFDPRKLDDPVLQTQSLLKSALNDNVGYLRAVSFANHGLP